MFIGYSTTRKGYKCYDPETKRVMVSRDVKFVETQGYYNRKNWEDLQHSDVPPTQQPQSTPDSPMNTNDESILEEEVTPEELVTQTTDNHDNEDIIPLRRNQRLKFPPPSNLKNTRVYYNNMAVAHPI
ncbi:PREDICTED: uncharacterized protein LOC104779117 [Camelina sativa]|uniref:Uncharacterized protein LOC104779117 n=1 Tax=Camelina sativa TaxID=90675 RepID=A0ABM0YJ93_CAMSA|nr:PREDICTED: uncharacterized protein LOC104779117 [Camelina sativa]